MLMRLAAMTALCVGMSGVAKAGEFDNDQKAPAKAAKPMASAMAKAGSEMDGESPTQACRFRGWGGFRGGWCGGWGGYRGCWGGYSYSCYTPCYSTCYTPVYNYCYTPCYTPVYTTCYTPISYSYASCYPAFSYRCF